MKRTSLLILLLPATILLAQSSSPTSDGKPTIRDGPQVAYKMNLAGSRFQEVGLADSQFDNSDLSGSTFRSVNFTRTSIRSANFTGAGIRSCNLSGVEVSTCQLDGMKIDGVLVTDLLEAYSRLKKK